MCRPILYYHSYQRGLKTFICTPVTTAQYNRGLMCTVIKQANVDSLITIC